MKTNIFEFFKQKNLETHLLQYWNGAKMPVAIEYSNNKRARLHLENEQFKLVFAEGSSIKEQKRLLEKLFDDFYKKQTKQYCEERLRTFQDVEHYRVGNIRIKKLKTRWGSCSRKGNLNFNRDLAKLPGSLRNYIIAHEYAHLKELNHSSRFWEVVRKFDPDFREHRSKLRHYEKMLIHR